METSRNAVAILVQANVPLIITGGAGVGKSSFVTGLARTMGAECFVLVPSTRDITDLTGTPVKTVKRHYFSQEIHESLMRDREQYMAGNLYCKDGAPDPDAYLESFRGKEFVEYEATSLIPPDWVHFLNNAKRGVLVLDETNTCSMAMQATLLGIALDGRVGDGKLRYSVSRVLIQNPPEIAPNGHELSAPMANRLIHINWNVIHSEWRRGKQDGWDTDYPILDISKMGSSVRYMSDLITAFLDHRPVLLEQMPDSEEYQSGPWPSPRSWDFVERGCAACMASGFPFPSPEFNLVVAGAVGAGASSEFLSWMRSATLISPQDALRDPTGFQMPNRGDLLAALLSGVTLYAQADITAYWSAVWKIFGRVANAGFKDQVIAACGSIAAAGAKLGLPIPPEAETLVGVLQYSALRV